MIQSVARNLKTKPAQLIHSNLSGSTSTICLNNTKLMTEGLTHRTRFYVLQNAKRLQTVSIPQEE